MKPVERSLDNEVCKELLTEYDRQLWVVLLGNGIVALLCYLIYAGAVAGGELLRWLLLVAGIMVLWAGVTWQFRRAAEPLDTRLWPGVFTLRSALHGCVWGVLAFLMPADGVFVGVTCAILTGMAGGALGTAIFLPAFIAFTAPMMLALAWNLFLLGGDIYLYLAVAAVIYLIVVTLFASMIARGHAYSIRLRLNNIALVEDLRHQKELAERANEDKTRFLAAASHDLRQPLHALSLFLNVLKKRGGSDDTLMNNISEAMRALEALFESLLDISRLDAGMVMPLLQRVSLAEVFGSMQNEFLPLAGQHGLRLDVVGSGLHVQSDPVLLENILRNLLSNAIRYTEQGRLLLGCRRRGNMAAIQVWDTGIGIAEGQLDDIFKEFYQVGNVERDRSKGLGLGLSIVRRQAELMGHRVVVRSRPGRGSLFEVIVPIEATGAPAAQPLPQAAPRRSLAGATVLVIDDEKHIRDAMRLTLEEAGCRVFTGESGADACEQLKLAEAVPDIVVSDFRLREHRTGLESIRMVRKLCGRYLPALLISGDTAPAVLREAQKQRIRLIHKPVESEELFHEIAGLLEGNPTN